jgi:hypothetical protein
LNQAVASRSKPALAEAMAACAALEGFAPGVLQVAQEILQSLTAEDDALRTMRKAMLSAKAGLYSENAPLLRESVSRAQASLGPAPPPLTVKYIAQAQELLAKIDAEDALVRALNAAVAHGDRSALELAVLNVESRLAGPERLEPARGGVGPNKATHSAVAAGKQALAQVNVAQRLTDALAKATASRDKAALEAALQAVAEHDASADEESANSTSAAAGANQGGKAPKTNPFQVASGETVALAQQVLAQVVAEDLGLGSLLDAQRQRLRQGLEDAIEAVRSEGLDDQSARVAEALAAAEALHVQLDLEAEAVRDAQLAVAVGDRDALQRAVDRAIDVFAAGGSGGVKAFEDSSVLAHAQAQLDKFTTEKELVISVAMAIGKQDRALLAAALDKASQDGHQHPTLAQAAQLRAATGKSCSKRSET